MSSKNIISLILFVIVSLLVTLLWKPWGEIIFWGMLGIQFLRMAILFWKRAKMFYLAIGWAFLVVVCFVMLLKNTMPIVEESDWWLLFVLTAPFIPLIMQWFEGQKNPVKIKKWKSLPSRVTFFELLSLKYISELEDKEKRPHHRHF